MLATFQQLVAHLVGVAITGTVVNTTISSDLPNRVPANTVQQLTPAGWQAATNTEILIDQKYRNTVLHTAQQYASKAATAHIPSGPQHDAIAQQAAQQVVHLLNQVFSALQQSIVLAIHNGLLVVLLFCGGAFLAACFLKDIPLKNSWGESNPVSSVAGGTETGETVPPVH